MKKILLALTILSVNAHAFGILSARQNLYSLKSNDSPNTKALRMEFGLFINEPIVYKLEYQSWTGLLLDQQFITKQDVLYKLNNNVKFGLGMNLGANDDTYSSYSEVAAVLEVKLW